MFNVFFKGKNKIDVIDWKIKNKYINGFKNVYFKLKYIQKDIKCIINIVIKHEIVNGTDLFFLTIFVTTW
jgi:hypothetical protein